MFKKIKAATATRRSGSQPASGPTNDPAPDQAEEITAAEVNDSIPEHMGNSPRDDEYLDSESAEAATAEAEAAEEGTRPRSAAATLSATASPSVPGSVGMQSHPITPDSPRPLTSPDTSAFTGSRVGVSPGLTMSSQRSPAPSSSASPGSEFQTHLRKVTANLVDLLDQISNSAGSSTNSPPGSSQGKKNLFYYFQHPILNFSMQGECGACLLAI